MIQINPLQRYIDGGARAAITTPPSASLVFDLPGRAIWVKGVKLKGTDHTYTFSHDNYISLTNTPGSNESEDILIGINTTLLKQAIDTTYGIVNATTNGLAPMFSSANKATAAAATTYNFLGIAGTTLKWYSLPWRNVRINAETSDKLGVNDTDPLIISQGTGISVTWDASGKKIVITNTAPDVNHNTDSSVAQTRTVLNKDYPLILKGSADSTGIIAGVNFNESITYNPSTSRLLINSQKVVTVADVYVGATASAAATSGLVPAATSAQRTYFLRGDGTWATPQDYNTWRPIKVNSSEKLGSGTDTGAVDFVAGTGITLGWDATNKKITITNSAPDLNHNTDRTGIKLGAVSGNKKADGTVILANSAVGLTIAGGTNKFSIGDGTNYIEVPITISHGLSTKNITINGTAYAIYTSASSLPTFVAPGSYAGTGGYILATNSAKNGLEWVAKPTSNVTTSAVIASSATATTQITAAQANPFYNLLEGGAVSRSILFVSGTGITISAAADGKITITNSAPDVNHNTHYTTSMYIGENNDTKANKVVTSPYLKLFDDNTRRSTLRFVSGIGISVASDANGNITITNNSPDVNHNVTTSAVIAASATGTVQITAALTNPYYNLLEGGVVARSIRFVAGNGITISAATDGLITITNSKPDVNHDTHYVTTMYIGESNDTKSNVVATNPYLKLFDNDTRRSTLRFVAGNGITIGSDASGNITITNSKPDVNHDTHYTTTMFAGENNDTKANKVATNPYLKLFDNDTRRSTLRFVAGTGITIASDANGNITVTNSAPDVNHDTHYTTHLYIGALNATSSSKQANPWITLCDNTTVRNSYQLKGDGASVQVNSDASGNVTTSLNVIYCRDDSSPSSKGLWKTIKNGKTSTTNSVRFYTIYASDGGPTNHGEMLEILSYNANHWQPQLWFGAGKGGHMYYRNKNYNDDTWGDWLTIADSGNVVDKSVTLTTTLQTIATIAGVEIKAKITNYNTDQNVKQTPKTDNVNRPLMMINGGTSAGELTTTTMFSTGIYANASTKTITSSGFIKTGSSDSYVLLGGGGHKAWGNANGNISVNNGTVCTNLNADMLDGIHAADFMQRVLADGSLALDAINFGNNAIIGTINGNTYTGNNGKGLDNRSVILHFSGGKYTGHWNLIYINSGSMAFRTENNKSWLEILHSGNSSVSGGGSSWGSSITVKINNTSATLTIPSNPNTDYRVTQNLDSTSADYRLLFKYSANDTNETNTVKYNTNLRYNPSSKLLTNDGPLWLRPGGDTTLKIYSGKVTDGYSDGFIKFQTSIDGTDGESHSYPTSYGNRCAIFLQPRGGEVYIGKDITAASTYADTTFKLNVGGHLNADGNIWARGSSRYLRIGPQNSSHAHYETDADISHWFNKRVDVNGAIWRYNTNYGIASDGQFYAKAVYANRDGSSTYGGVSLYSNDANTYAIFFRGTGTYGTHGGVTSDWATYLTMSDTTNRGWIFRRGSTNVASIDGRGYGYFNEGLYGKYLQLGHLSNWNSAAYTENKIQFLQYSGSNPTGGAGAYYAGVSFVTNYVGFQLATYGGGGEDIKFRKLQDNGTWHSWYSFITAANYTSYVNPRAVSKTIWGLTYIDANGNFLNVNGLLTITANSASVTIGPQNSSWCHYSSSVPHWFNTNVCVNGQLYPYSNASFDLGGSGNKWRYFYLNNRAYLDEWIQFSGYTGLYCPNANGAHWYPNNASSYGTWLMQGSRNGYAGVQLGASTSYMTVMDNSNDKGLFQEGQRWILYYNRSNQNLSLRTSSNYGANLNIEGTVYARGSSIQWGNGDARLIIYGVNTCCGAENVAFQTTFDDQDPLTSSYVTSYRTRAAILLQPRGGNVGINVSNDPSYPLHVGGNVGATHYYETSDIRLKHDISMLSKSIRRFRFNNDNKLYYGFIAQELETLHPELVDSSGEYKTVNYNSAICYYIAELENKVQKLEDEINKLKNK